MLRLLRKCNSFAQHRKSDRLGTFPSGDSSAMWNIRNQFCFVLNLYTCGWGNATHPPDIRIWGRAPSLPGQGQDRPTALKIGTQYIAVNNSGTRRYRRFWPPPSEENPANLLTVARERGAVFIGFYKRFHKRSLVVWFFHSYVFPICVVFLFIRFPLSYAPQLSTYFPLSRSLYGNILTGIETWSNV